MQRLQKIFCYGFGRHFSETISPLFKQIAAAATSITYTRITSLLFVFSFLVIAFCVNFGVVVIVPSGSSSSKLTSKTRIHYSLNCTTSNQTQTCPKISPHFSPKYQSPPPPSCPDYFHWIHEDLRPWKETGITREMLESLRDTAHFKLVVLNGKAYVEMIAKCFQTRDKFTLWGIMQLLKLYPGRLPDLELMFNCNDRPVILARDYKGKGPNATVPPPLFRYCRSDETLDIPFPDWSFWVNNYRICSKDCPKAQASGACNCFSVRMSVRPETNIKPWVSLLKELEEGNKKVKWMDREPYAYWKGNPDVAETRKDLMKCNLSDKHDWNARLYDQNWAAAVQGGYKQSNLADQCIHRYKIYIEGLAWSASGKYILACDSVPLLVMPRYYDIFLRGLVPLHHYWPIKSNDKCRSIKYAVDWGNAHNEQAQEIGRTASNFINKNMSMEYVYDYMFHILNEYARLLRFKPSKPENAVEYCSETMACRAEGRERKFFMESMVKSPSDSGPCDMPPPMDPPTRESINRRNANTVQQVELWQKKYWEHQTKQL